MYLLDTNNMNSAFVGGTTRGDGHRRGRVVGYADSLIAATARAYGLTLVTRNVRHFDHVTGLKVENWFEANPAASARSQ